jgi:transcriptional regulator with XRE-family HTH domain
MGKRGPNPRDTEISKRLRALRLQRAWSQAELGKKLGVTSQQVQKYERGSNRIAAGRLAGIADMFGVPIMYFFGGDERRRSAPGSRPIAVEFDFLQTEGAIRLVRAYSRIKDPRLRSTLLKLAESLAGR